MSTQIDYHLSIRVETPKTVGEGEPFKVTYHIKNIGENIFPGGEISVRVDWVKLGLKPFVIHTIKITKTLQPNAEFTYITRETPLASGYTMFLLPSPLPTSPSGDYLSGHHLLL